MLSHDRHAVLIAVRVVPRASRSQVAGVRDNALLVRLTAPPVEGAANDELVRLMADVLHVPKRSVSIATGERSRTKTVRVEGVTVDAVARALAVFATPAEPRSSDS